MTILNNEAAHRLEMEVDGGTAVLNYRLEPDTQKPETMSLLFVGVPDASRGRGIAAELSRTALEIARERGLKVVPICSYVAAYVRRHPEYQEMLR